MQQNRLVKIATAQSTVDKDIRKNGENIRRLILAASNAKAGLVHFSEGALSGYSKSQISSFQEFNWQLLEEELELTRLLCQSLGISAVLGSCHPMSGLQRPRNSLYIINSKGIISFRYDKRFCSHTEITDWYSAGKQPVVFELNGIRFGCAICIEIQFPEIFLEYEKLDVDCLLFSSYSDSIMFGTQAQGHAACNNYWISMSVPTNGSDKLPARFIGPNGDLISECERGNDSIVVNEINPEDKQWEIPLKLARPWRRTARKGEIY